MRSLAVRPRLLVTMVAGMGVAATESRAQETTSQAAVPAELVGTDWRLAELDGRPPDPDLPPVTLSFGPLRAEGSGGCNWYAAWLGDGRDGGLAVSNLAATRRDCRHPRIMERETRYLAALEEFSGYRLTKGALALTFGTTDEETRLVFTPD